MNLITKVAVENMEHILHGYDKEVVNHPEHYNGDSVYECIKVLKAWMTPDEYKGFLKGNTLKYLCRVGKKDAELQELKKAKWYLDELVKSME